MPPLAAHNLSSPSPSTLENTVSEADMYTTSKRRAARTQSYQSLPPAPSQGQVQRFEKDVMDYLVTRVAPNLIRQTHHTLDKGALTKLDIVCSEIDLITGQLRTRPRFPNIFFRPLDPSVVKGLLDEMNFSVEERDFTYRKGDGWGEDRYKEARDNLRSMSNLVVQSSKHNKKLGGGHTLLTAHSPWRINSEPLQYMSRPNPQLGCPPIWSAFESWRPCLQDHLITPSVQHPDPRKPHLFATFASDIQMEDKEILTGEAQVILMLACNYGSQAQYQHHQMIPRTFRVVQGIIDLHTKEIEIRLSKKVKLPEGPSGDWKTFYTLLGWMMASPVHETLKA